MKNFWQLLVTALTFGPFFYLLNREDSLALIRDVSLGYCLLILLIKLFVSFANALKFREIVIVNKLPLNTLEWNGLSYITTFYSYFLPARLGNVFRAVYLKKNYNFEYSRFVSLLIGSTVIDIFITCLLGILSVLYSYRMAEFSEIWILVIFTSILLIMLAMFPIALFLSRKQFHVKIVKLNRFICYLQESFEFFVGRPKFFVKFCFIALMSLLVRGLALFSCFIVFGVSPDICMIFIAICFVNFTCMASLTPGNLGITEGTLAGVFALLGLPLNPGIQVIALSRVTSLVVQSVLGVIFSQVLFGRLFLSKNKFG